jgi:hypothetical protein
MSHGLREYRIILRRLAQANPGLAHQFTAIVRATQADDALSEAEKLIETLGGGFRIEEILEGPAPDPA